ncbi:MAG: hypothetical protein ACRCVD_03440 [Halioglobus sp.]
MIDVAAIIMAVALAAMVARWADKDHEKDRHNMWCIGICAHIQEDDRGALEPVEVTAEKLDLVVAPNKPKVLHWHSPADSAPEGASTGEVK